jgi:hypothetical protein
MHAPLSFVIACAGLALINGALVALPAQAAPGRLERLRSPAWALVFPGSLIAGTFGVLALPTMPADLAVLASVATPALAGIAVVAVVRGRNRLLLLVPLVFLLGATLAGWPGQLAASLVTALGCLTLGAGLVRLTPAPWVAVGVLAMCAVDVLLIAAGVGQPPAALFNSAVSGLPALDHAQLGPITRDYPDLVLAAAVGGLLAGRPAQRRAAVLVALLSGAYTSLLTFAEILPATVPLALAFVVLELGPHRARLRSPAERQPSASAAISRGVPAILYIAPNTTADRAMEPSPSMTPAASC